jgi:transcriptional regulator with XRE-family HTH domain
MMKIGRNIREIRRNKRIRQIDLAESSGISNTYLSDIENGRTTPSLKALIRIAASLDIDIAELLK